MGATPLVISVSGIRGIVGESLTPEVVATYAAAHGAAAVARTGRSTVVLGRDARVSGPFLAAAAESGLRSVGCEVLDVGMACTPTILLVVEEENSRVVADHTTAAKFTTSAPTVVKIDAGGMLTTAGGTGDATVTATANGRTASIGTA